MEFSNLSVDNYDNYQELNHKKVSWESWNNIYWGVEHKVHQSTGKIVALLRDTAFDMEKTV